MAEIDNSYDPRVMPRFSARLFEVALGGRCGFLGRGCRWRPAFLAIGIFATLAIGGARADEAAPARGEDRLSFARDVQPILAKNCFECHGPDAESRAGDLRLDVLDGEDARGASEVIQAGAPGESELIARITSDDPEIRMPPADTDKVLTPNERSILESWVAQGGEYETHWAFVAPERAPLPAVGDGAWVRNPIDRFVLQRLEAEGLRPSPRADRLALLRRLHLDLTGLPPSHGAVRAMERVSDDQVEELLKATIEELLASPHFGERWARLWLDAARYADSDGYEKDKPREVWMYRDWVIRAFNRDMPYDEFVVAQIAGDLLPGAGQDQHVATGFLRNSMINEEGGVDPEQFRMEAMFDRMDAVGKGVLGLTVQCAQCHTHKYDPLTHTDYYRMFAFLNNSHEGQIAVYTDEERAQWSQTEQVIRQIEDRLRGRMPEWRERMAAWERGLAQGAAEWRIVRPELDSSGGQKHYLLSDGSIRADGYAPTIHTTEFVVDVDSGTVTALRLELLNDPNLPRGGPGRSIHGLCALTEFEAVATPPGGGEAVPLKFKEASADVNPPERELEAAFDDRSNRRRVTGGIAYAVDGNPLTAWGIDVGAGRSNVPHEAVFVLENPLDCSGGKRITFKLAQHHGGWNSDDNQNNNLGRFRFAVTEDAEAKADAIPGVVRQALAKGAQERTEAETGAIFSYWRTTVAEWAEENRQIEALHTSHPRGTTQLVLIERDEPRTSHRLDRGSFLSPAEEVEAGVPTFLHPLEVEGASANRLDFARWLVDRRSPTTARSIVNRIWQAYFGRGLVETPEDFGTQGAPPTHPELLDWLAVELMENDWSLKHIHRLIVDSATYRQRCDVDPELLESDPANELLARGARFRLDAEIVRDVALAASGLLEKSVGGPSVYPPAPEFLFRPPASYGPKTWRFDADGRAMYRRGLYTFRYRSVPHPALQNFDAPVGEISCVRRARSNTPLQALTTLNEPLFVACARQLAVSALESGGEGDTERLDYVVRACLSRSPDREEHEILSQFLEQQRERFARNEEQAWRLIADDEDARETLRTEFKEGGTAPELAAWTALARVVLNLDETITRE